MKPIEITVTGNEVAVTKTVPLTAGSVGQPVIFRFDSSWEGLRKTAVFRVGEKVRHIENIEDTVIIPPETLKYPNLSLYIGVYGTADAGLLTVPTLWALAGTIQPGAQPHGTEGTDVAAAKQALEIFISETKAEQTAFLEQAEKKQAVFAERIESDQAAFTQKAEADQNAFLETAGKALGEIWDAAVAPSDIVCQMSGVGIDVTNASDRLIHGLKLCGKTVQDGTPTPETPVEPVSVGDGGSVEVTVAGKNLMVSVEAETILEKNGVTVTFYPDGSWVANGTATDDTWIFLHSKWNTPSAVEEYLTVKAGTYTFSDTNKNVSKTTFFIAMQSAPYNGAFDLGLHTTSTRTFTAEEDMKFEVGLRIKSGVTLNNEVFRPQLEIGTEATEYESYRPAQTLTVSTPNGLPGIPVASGGNYTDENGQQWVCDEVDFARGVYVQRVYTADFSQGNWVCSVEPKSNGTYRMMFFANKNQGMVPADIRATNANGFCSHFVWNNQPVYGNGVNNAVYVYSENIAFRCDEFNGDGVGFAAWLKENAVKVQYQLATPIETPLPEEELAAYRALHTNKPNTTVCNDAGAHMELSYAADTKLYIDNKFAELAAAIVNNA